MRTAGVAGTEIGVSPGPKSVWQKSPSVHFPGLGRNRCRATPVRLDVCTFHLDGCRGLNPIIGSGSLLARVGPTTRMAL